MITTIIPSVYLDLLFFSVQVRHPIFFSKQRRLRFLANLSDKLSLKESVYDGLRPAEQTRITQLRSDIEDIGYDVFLRYRQCWFEGPHERITTVMQLHVD
ncbi:hypothetical protein Tco_1338040 [Tanacetum coccineum]